MEAPKAAKKPITRLHHGIEYVDDYEWMRDKENPEVISYLEAENAYTDQETAGLKPLEDKIYSEILGRIKQTDMSVPSRSHGYWYFSRISEGDNYGRYCRVPVASQDNQNADSVDSWLPPKIEPDQVLPNEEVVIDVEKLSKGHEFFNVGGIHIKQTTDNVLYGVDITGSERYSLRVFNLKTGEYYPEVIENTHGSGYWLSEEYFVYERSDEAWRPCQLWRHKLGTPVEEDVLIYEEPDERFWVGCGLTLDTRYLVVTSASKTTSEQWYLDTKADPTGELKLIRAREEGVEYAVEFAEVDDQVHALVIHNKNHINAELGETTLTEDTFPLDFGALNVMIPPSDDMRVEGVDAYKNFILAAYRREGIGRAAVMKINPGFGEFVELKWDEELVSCGVSGAGQWDSPVIRVSYSSFLTPSVLYQVDVTKDVNDPSARIVLRESEILGGYDPKDYVAYREWITATDGTRIPVSIVHRADLDTSKPNPMFLYGYGSYETCIDPGTSVSRLSLLDRGIIFVIAHIRGGGEMGRLWYEEGRLDKKKNTFTDFIDVARGLVAKGMTTPEQICACGGSAGGLLMGAVANMAPDLFKAILAEVPFVDALTSILMPELPLTVIEWDEWGDPLHNKDIYEYMASYTPYENIAPVMYPDILITSSINDTRVLYVEPTKWVAKLRDTAQGKFLLRMYMNAGHGGASGRYDSFRQTAFAYAWVVNEITGKTE
ncbi:MAG: S9 family peptidase [Corynebacterium sp.]|nr:S9 family peptidase [Corynebacterium sp.]